MFIEGVIGQSLLLGPFIFHPNQPKGTNGRPESLNGFFEYVVGCALGDGGMEIDIRTADVDDVD